MTDWKNSDAKVHLRGLIESGAIDGMPPREVIKLCPTMFQPFKKNFANNLRTLRNTIQREKDNIGKPQLPAWRTSEAKKDLRRLLLEDSQTRNKDPEDVHKSNPLFEQYPLDRFKDNFKNLLESVLEDETAVKFDEEAIKKDNRLYPTQPICSHGHPRWDGSTAQRLLKDAIKNGEHTNKKPKELFHSNIAAYGPFGLNVFRGHIYQEDRSNRETSYWLDRKKKEIEKKKK
jgi:hypothetical protein